MQPGYPHAHAAQQIAWSARRTHQRVNVQPPPWTLQGRRTACTDCSKHCVSLIAPCGVAYHAVAARGHLGPHPPPRSAALCRASRPSDDTGSLSADHCDGQYTKRVFFEVYHPSVGSAGNACRFGQGQRRVTNQSASCSRSPHPPLKKHPTRKGYWWQADRRSASPPSHNRFTGRKGNLVTGKATAVRSTSSTGVIGPAELAAFVRSRGQESFGRSDEHVAGAHAHILHATPARQGNAFHHAARDGVEALPALVPKPCTARMQAAVLFHREGQSSAPIKHPPNNHKGLHCGHEGARHRLATPTWHKNKVRSPPARQHKTLWSSKHFT